MKQFEVQAIGVEEITAEEMSYIDGGFPWWGLIQALGDIAMGVAVGWFLYEDSIVEVDGGDLEPAYCYG